MHVEKYKRDGKKRLKERARVRGEGKGGGGKAVSKRGEEKEGEEPRTCGRGDEIWSETGSDLIKIYYVALSLN